MHQPSHFQESRVDVLHPLMRAHPFATLIAHSAGVPEINHLPLVLDVPASHAEGPTGHGVLRGHVARPNPLVRHFAAGGEAVAVFTAADHYISPAWYPSKQRDPRVVPTWNYVVVHAHGTLRIVDDADWVLAMITDLTNQHEAGRPGRWHVSDAPADYLQTMLRAIVGVELTITRLEGKVKASQNRSEEDRGGVVRGLISESSEAALAMSRWTPINVDSQ